MLIVIGMPLFCFSTYAYGGGPDGENGGGKREEGGEEGDEGWRGGQGGRGGETTRNHPRGNIAILLVVAITRNELIQIHELPLQKVCNHYYFHAGIHTTLGLAHAARCSHVPCQCRSYYRHSILPVMTTWTPAVRTTRRSSRLAQHKRPIQEHAPGPSAPWRVGDRWNPELRFAWQGCVRPPA